MNHRESRLVIPSIEEAPKLDLKALPPHLSYVFLGRDDTLPIIIAADLNVQQVECMVEVLGDSNEPLVGILWTLLGFLPVFDHTKSNSCPIIRQILSTRDG